jgi:ABC-type branched-subunit amino acid transport system ATPase component
VAEVGFEARPGQITSLIGPNGAGKTTVLNLICGFYRPDHGSARLGTQELAGRPSHEVARAGLARTYQTSQLLGQMSVIENILVGLRGPRLGSFAAALIWPEDETALRARAADLLAFVGYGSPLEVPAASLPHVDRRLVEIARALAIKPRVLMLDEPAAGLTRADKTRLADLLRRIADAGIAVLLVEHDMDLVMGLSHHVIVLDAGRCIAAGLPAEVQADPTVRKAYLGEGEIGGRGRSAAYQPGETVLEVQDLTVAYGQIAALHGVSLAVGQGEMVGVLGANGAGKSTLMRALSGLHRPKSGAIALESKSITGTPTHQIVRAGLVLVPEGRQVFPELSVRDNLELGAFTRNDRAVESDVAQLLDRFPALRQRAGSRAGLLSGGEQQMLAIARGLIARPTILLLDEPSLGLAPTLVAQLFDELAALRDEGITILLVDQMAGLTLSVADRAYILESGRILQAGTADSLRGDPELERAYLGKAASAPA